MKVTFNSLGQIVGGIDYEGQTIRQGSTEIVLKAAFQDKLNINYNAKFNLTRSDGTNITNVTMNLGTDSNSYIFALNDEWYFAKSGQTTLTVFLVDGNGTQIATGQVQFNVQANDYDEEPETITEEQYNSLLALISKKVGFKTKTVRVTELPEVGEEDTVYFLEYSNRSLVEAYIYSAENGEYQYLGSNSIDLGNYYERAEGEEFERDIDSRVTNVENELSSIASGSPKGVYATLAALQSAYPTGADGIYVVSANGHWFYWNGSAWTDGGSYLSSLADNNLDKTSSNSAKNSILSKIISFNRSIDNIIPLNKSDFAMTNLSGEVSTTRMLSTYIPIKSGSQLLLQCDSDINIIVNQYYYSNGVYVDNGAAYNKASVQTNGYHGNNDIFLIKSNTTHIRIYFKFTDDRSFVLQDIVNYNMKLSYYNDIEPFQQCEMIKSNKSNLLPMDINAYENGSILADGTENETFGRLKLKSANAFLIDEGTKLKVSFLKETDFKLLFSYYDNEGNFLSATGYITSSAVIAPNSNARKVRIVIANDTYQSAICPDMVFEMPIIVEKYSDEQMLIDKTDGLDRAMFKEHIIIMTFNLGQFYNGAQKCPDDQVANQKERYKELFAKYRPDLICTQETPEYANVSNTIKGKTFFEDMYKYYEGDLGSLGQIYVSNKPILQQPVKAFYTSGSDTSRYYEKTYIYFNGIKIAVFNTHLSLTAEDRALELQELLTAMNQEEYVILCGDFNTNEGFSELQPLTNDGYVLANGGSVGNFKTCGDLYIDNIIVSPNITIEKALVENSLFEDRNDHRPFCAMLKIGIADIWNS